MSRFTERVRLKCFMIACVALTGCASEMANHLNPFAEDGPDLGETSLKPILDEAGSGGTSSAQAARQALEVMGSYDRAHAPQPTNPVMRPAVVRLMWVPDHLNAAGDLVPSHYYYLRVRDQVWNVQDAFDIEQQLNVETKGGTGGATPWV
jgi:hypothetical protein